MQPTHALHELVRIAADLNRRSRPQVPPFHRVRVRVHHLNLDLMAIGFGCECVGRPVCQPEADYCHGKNTVLDAQKHPIPTNMCKSLVTMKPYPGRESTPSVRDGAAVKDDIAQTAKIPPRRLTPAMVG